MTCCECSHKCEFYAVCLGQCKDIQVQNDVTKPDSEKQILDKQAAENPFGLIVLQCNTCIKEPCEI